MEIFYWYKNWPPCVVFLLECCYNKLPFMFYLYWTLSHLGFCCLTNQKSSSPSNLCLVITTFVVLVLATNTNIYAQTWSFLHFIVVILFFFQISRQGDWMACWLLRCYWLAHPRIQKISTFFWSCSIRELSVRSCCLPRPAAAIQVFLWEIFLFGRFYKLQKKLEEMWSPLYTVGLWHTH